MLNLLGCVCLNSVVRMRGLSLNLLGRDFMMRERLSI